MIKRTISHSHIVWQPGDGGIGLIYEAEDLKLNRRVALKFLPGEMKNDPDARERFRCEALAASALSSEMRFSTRDLCMSVQTKVWVR